MANYIPIRFEPTELYFEERRPNKNKMSSDMGSVPDPRIMYLHACIATLRVLLYPKSVMRKFPPPTVDGEAANLLRTCCGLVGDTANKSAASRCN